MSTTCKWCGRHIAPGTYVSGWSGGHDVCSEKCRLQLTGSIRAGHTRPRKDDLAELPRVLGNLLVLFLLVGGLFMLSILFVDKEPQAAEAAPAAQMDGAVAEPTTDEPDSGADLGGEALTEEAPTVEQVRQEPIPPSEELTSGSAGEVLTTDPVPVEAASPEELVDMEPLAPSLSAETPEGQARRMLAQQEDVGDIARATGLTRGEVRRVRREMRDAGELAD